MKLSIMGYVGVLVMVLLSVYVYNRFIADEGKSISDLGKA